MAVDAARVGGEVCAGEAFDRSGLEQDDACQNLADAGHRCQQGIIGARLDFFLQALFQQFNLRGERCDDCYIGMDRQADVGGKSHLVNGFGFQP
ncbi:hypothetical protein D9M73_275060 [compost metagenome]